MGLGLPPTRSGSLLRQAPPQAWLAPRAGRCRWFLDFACIIVMLLVSASFRCAAQRPSVHDPVGPPRHVAKPERRLDPTSPEDFKPVDHWFSYGPSEKVGAGHDFSPPALLGLSPAGSSAISFGSIEEEIVIVGERQMRDFMLVKPDAELTGPQALDAAQPFVPWPGTTCNYKNLCYDLSQPPLRAVIPRLGSLLFGD